MVSCFTIRTKSMKDFMIESDLIPLPYSNKVKTKLNRDKEILCLFFGKRRLMKALRQPHAGSVCDLPPPTVGHLWHPHHSHSPVINHFPRRNTLRFFLSERHMTVTSDL